LARGVEGIEGDERGRERRGSPAAR
jgi:hypothetical protein